MNLESKIEAILFWKGEPMSRKKLSDILEVGQTELNEAKAALDSVSADTGVSFILLPIPKDKKDR